MRLGALDIPVLFMMSMKCLKIGTKPHKISIQHLALNQGVQGSNP